MPKGKGYRRSSHSTSGRSMIGESMNEYHKRKSAERQRRGLTGFTRQGRSSSVSQGAAHERETRAADPFGRARGESPLSRDARRRQGPANRLRGLGFN